ncbi:MAG: helix-turn-helix domain-containing protein [Bacteroidetes bacterium]|nr:helix-turn-helix domain-containing protein [Bacteroidota bacterium]
MHVGKKIRHFRVIKGWSQQQLADLIHKARPLISHIESTGKVNHDTLMSICKALKISPDLFHSASDEPFPDYSFQSPDMRLLKAENERLLAELKLKDEIISMLKSHNKELSARKKK